eukprot:TRINITY_DN89088_c0_g1_i1.p1 TRINITY_DN89088_c0_g1~~TRINITY_DN89088_c0_g1_i1.p1  ORF type:complete len:415 (-),score=6.08 TRINITY_DN89088_c0_g1_i1:84-1232(-)
MVITEQFWNIGIAVLLFGLILLLELFFRDPLYNLSMDMIPRWQKSRTHFFDQLFLLVSVFGGQTGILALFVLLYIICSRTFFIKMLFPLFIAQILSNFLKLLYQQPRPSTILNQCQPGFGNPSHHCMNIASIYGSLWLLWYRSISEKVNKNLAFARTTLGLIILAIIMTCIARVYLGAHTINQVLYGTLLGLWIAFVAGVTVPQYIDTHLELLIKAPALIGMDQLLVIIVTAIIQLINILMFLLYKDKHWNQSENCRFNPAEFMFGELLSTTLCTFLYFAQLISIKHFIHVFTYWHYPVTAAKYTGRAVVVLIVVIVCLIPFFATLNADFVVRMVIGIVLTNSLLCFIGIPAVDWLSLKLNLVEIPVPNEDLRTYGTLEMVQ